MRRLVPRDRFLFAYDLVVVALAIALAFALRFDARQWLASLTPYLPVALLPLVVRPPVNVVFGLYRREWRFASVQELRTITAAVGVGSMVSVGLFLVLALLDVPGSRGFPRMVFPLEGMLSLLFIGGARFAVRARMERRGAPGARSDGAAPARALVYGAGETGVMVARLAARDDATGIEIVGYLDDDPRKRGSALMGRRVLGDLDDLEAAVRRTGATQLVVAMPSAPGAVVRRALETGRQAGLEVRTIPHPRAFLEGLPEPAAPRPISLDDLLRRASFRFDEAAVRRSLQDDCVLVTGAGGTIGSELARQLRALGPRRLVLLDHHEGALWQIERELRASGPDDGRLRAILGDVRSREVVDAIVRSERPQAVFHAAALKHVPIVEANPSEGVMTNVFGTRNLLDACEAHGVERFVLISTDKAVDPVSVMGATKRLAELLTAGSAARTGRPYVTVRFGNVLGSSGSVIPILQEQLREGEPITITDPEATRFFMTIQEAVSLVLEAGSLAGEGELFVLDMGDPIRIVDLAMDLARLSGIDPSRVRMTVTGLRPGERLHERLAASHECLEASGQPGILHVRPSTPTAGSPTAGSAAADPGSAAGSSSDAPDAAGSDAAGEAPDLTALGHLPALEAAAFSRDDDAAVATLRAAGCLRTVGAMGGARDPGASAPLAEGSVAPA
jgi:FlaA1/EpsC-like NDP-sugar epimerase